MARSRSWASEVGGRSGAHTGPFDSRHTLRVVARLLVRAPIVAALCLLAVVPARAQERSGVEAGRKLADVHCSRCHAVGNEGASLMEGAPPLRDIKLRYPVDDLAEALAEGMETAHPQMPVFTFSPEEIDELLAYLDSLE